MWNFENFPINYYKNVHPNKVIELWKQKCVRSELRSDMGGEKAGEIKDQFPVKKLKIHGQKWRVPFPKQAKRNDLKVEIQRVWLFISADRWQLSPMALYTVLHLTYQIYWHFYLILCCGCILFCDTSIVTHWQKHAPHAHIPLLAAIESSNNFKNSTTVLSKFGIRENKKP